MNIKSYPPGARRTIFALGIFNFLYYFNFFWLIVNIYFEEKLGSYTLLQILLGIWAVLTLILEVPSGALADKYGRKNILIIGSFAWLIGLLFFILLPSFVGLVIGITFWSIHSSFISGSMEALLYDNLKENAIEKKFNSAIALIHSLKNIGLGIGMIFAGFLTSYGYNYNFLPSIIIAALCTYSLMFIDEAKRVHTPSEETKYIQFIKNAFLYLKKDLKLRTILIFACSSLLSYIIISEYFVIAVKKVGFIYQAIGFIAAVEAVFYLTGSYLTKYTTKLNSIYIYISISAAFVLLYLLISIGSRLIVVLGFLILRSVMAISEITYMSDWQNRVESLDRATSTSVISFFQNSLYLPLGIIFGGLADKIGLFPSFRYILLLPIIFIIFLMVSLLRAKSLL